MRVRKTPCLLRGVLTLGTGLVIGLGASGTADGSTNAARHHLRPLFGTKAGHGERIVATAKGIYKVTNGGHRWTKITPPGISSSHVMKIVAYGDQRIWLEMDGDSRFDFIPYSRDGGVTWQTTDLPDGANNPQSLRFTSANDGQVIAHTSSSPTVQNDDEKLVLQTVDGGTSWTIISSNLQVSQTVTAQPDQPAPSPTTTTITAPPPPSTTTTEKPSWITSVS